MTHFPVMGESAYVSYVGAMLHRGANPSTHLAEIRYPVQSAPVISVVKLLQPNGLRACNEAISWLFLRAAGLRAPKHAAILTLSEAKLVQILGRKLVPTEWANNGYLLAWAAQKFDFKSIQALFVGSQADSRWLELLRTAEGTAIAAFDEVFLNIDRNTGNVLFIRRDNCVPIDHELIFGQQDWTSSDLQHMSVDGDSLRVLKRARDASRLSLDDYDRLGNLMVHHGRAHKAALEACQEAVRNLLSKVYPSMADEISDRVLSFVGTRVAEHWLEERLGVI